MNFDIPKFYGSAAIFDKTENKPVLMQVYKSKSDKLTGMVTLKAFVEDNDGNMDFVGKVSYTKYAEGLAYGKYGSRNFATENKVFLEYGAGEEKERCVSKIFIDYIRTEYHDFAQAGTKLMQVVYEISLKDKYGSNGRVQLEAIKDSPVFYHLNGYKAQTIPDRLKATDPSSLEICQTLTQVDEALARQRLLPDKGRGINLGGMHMYLPKSEYVTWKNKADFVPILATKP